MNYATVNPTTGELVMKFANHPFPDLKLSKEALRNWRKLSVEERMIRLMKVAEILHQRSAEFARLITLEMGKPIAEAEYEIAKTITAFEYYNTHAAHFLESYEVKTQASKSFVVFDPLGIIFSIMPWNFPFWQVFRFAVPTLAAGNVTILKHAPNVPQCAAVIEQIFHEAGLQDGLLKNYFLTNEDASKLLAHEDVAGLSFTGSDTTGSLLAAQAGKHIKKSVMELGGNDAFIVLKDADMEQTIAGAVKSRCINAGQACNGAKRFIVEAAIHDEFIEKLIAAMSKLTVGDPFNRGTQVGPLARLDLAEKVRNQIAKSVADGALAHHHPFHGQEQGCFVAPVVLSNVSPSVTSFNEEIFGPVFSVIKAENFDHAIQLANQSRYGLAASVWTKNLDLALSRVSDIEVGNVFINDIVKSDARLPFGGVKNSGFGRELSEQGLKEFVNVKTVYAGKFLP